MGSFGFLQALNDGKSIHDILGSNCEEPIFMVNPLVFRFILWFLSSSDFDFLRKDKCYDKLKSYAAERIDSRVLDTDEVSDNYPAIDMSPDEPFDYSTVRQFFHGTLNKCKHVRTVELSRHSIYFLRQFSGLMEKDFFDRLKKIIIGPDTFEVRNIDDNSPILSIHAHYDDALEIMNLLLQKHNLSHRSPQIYLKSAIITGTRFDITHVLRKHCKKLYINRWITNSASIAASGELPHCPILTDLTIVGLHIEQSVPSALLRAIQSGKCPSLTHIEILVACGATSSSDWPVKVNVLSTRDTKNCTICSRKINDDEISSSEES